MRLLICAGGTGGGVYPALAVLQALTMDEAVHGAEPRRQTTDQPSSVVDRLPSVLWIGTEGGMEADLVKRAGIPLETIPAAGVHGVGWRALPRNLLRLGQGLLAARRVLSSFRPDVLFFTGGYVAVPVALAGRLPLPGSHRPRILLYVPDIEPGLALRTIARFADRIGLTVEASRAYFPAAQQDKLLITGYPVRADLHPMDPAAARESLELAPDLPTLLVMGGSSGARGINRPLVTALPELLKFAQVIHLSGRLDWPDIQATADKLPEDIAIRYRPYPYLHSDRMSAVLSASDLAITRSGASTLGELPLFGLPAILVPYPYAWRYQLVNAEWLAQDKAAVVLPENELPDQLLPLVRRLFAERKELEHMRAAMRAQAKPQAATNLAGLLTNLALGQAGGAS